MGASVPPAAAQGASGAPLAPAPNAGEAVQAVSRLLVNALESEGPDAVRRHLAHEIRGAFGIDRALVIALAEREGRATVIANDPPEADQRSSIALGELSAVSDLVEGGLLHMQVSGEGVAAPRPAAGRHRRVLGAAGAHALARPARPRARAPLRERADVLLRRGGAGGRLRRRRGGQPGPASPGRGAGRTAPPARRRWCARGGSSTRASTSHGCWCASARRPPASWAATAPASGWATGWPASGWRRCTGSRRSWSAPG